MASERFTPRIQFISEFDVCFIARACLLTILVSFVFFPPNQIRNISFQQIVYKTFSVLRFGSVYVLNGYTYLTLHLCAYLIVWFLLNPVFIRVRRQTTFLTFLIIDNDILIPLSHKQNSQILFFRSRCPIGAQTHSLSRLSFDSGKSIKNALNYSPTKKTTC